MELSALENAIARKALEKRIFIFGGKEDFLKERAIEKIVRAYVASEDISENVRRIDFDSARLEDFFQNLSVFSFNDSRRVSILLNPESLDSTERKTLFARLASPTLPSDVLVIFLPNETSIVNEITKNLGELGERVDFWPPFENQLNNWIQKETRDQGASITPEAAEVLLEKAGADLRVLYQEIVKLSLQAEKGKPISLEMVEKNVAYLRKDSVFDLMEGIGMKNLTFSLRTLESLLQMGEPAMKIWSMITKTLRDYRLLHDLVLDRKDLFEPILKDLKIILKLHGKSDYKSNLERKKVISSVQEKAKELPPFFGENLKLENAGQVKSISFALNYSREELVSIWPRILEMDMTIKSSPPNLNLTFQKFLIELLSPKKGKSL